MVDYSHISIGSTWCREKHGKTDSEQQYGEGRASNPAISLPFSGIILSVFTVAAVLALEWPPEVRQFPITVAIPGLILAALTILMDGRTFRETLPGFSSLGAMLSEASQKAALSKSCLFVSILGGMIAVMLFLGYKLALPLFVFTYLTFWARYSLWVGVIYPLCGWVFIIGFYDRIINLSFHVPLLKSVIQYLLPDWLPEWFIL